jgi:hypothetical protein
MCNYDLPAPDAHKFTAPPHIHSLAYSGSAINQISVYVLVPQTHPLRWNISANLVNDRTGSQTTMPYSNFDDKQCSLFTLGKYLPCYWEAKKVWNLDYLVQNGQPLTYIVPNETDYYAVQFGVDVHWCETLYMYRSDHSQPRCMSASLKFEIYVTRTLNLHTNITMADSTVLWAYVRRGFLVIPEDKSTPYFEIELETLPKSGTMIIENSSFYSIPESWGGHILYITNLTMQSNTDHYQQWSYRVYFRNYSFCSLNESDTYEISYNLISTVDNAVAVRNIMTMKLTSSEDWCADHIELDIKGRQRTFPLQSYVYEPPSDNSINNFFRGTTIYVVVDISLENHNLPVVGMAVLNVWLYGDAAKWAGSRHIYEHTNETIYSDFDWNVTEFNCSHGTPIIPQACYSFFLKDTLLEEKKALVIQTEAKLVFEAKRRASVNFDSKALTSSSHLFVHSSEVKATQNTVIVYHVTPVFMAAMGILIAVSVLSMVSTAFIVLRRQ